MSDNNSNAAAVNEHSAKRSRVRCGWCPMLLPDDHDAWYLHFLTEHGMTGYSIDLRVQGDDWDITELTETRP